MRLYVDTPLILEYPQGNPPYSGLVNAQLNRTGVDALFTPLSRMSCLAVALEPASQLDRLDVDIYFAAGLRIGLTDAVFERAAGIRATHRFREIDCINLAAATVHGCDEFLTRTRRLGRYTGVPVTVV